MSIVFLSQEAPPQQRVDTDKDNMWSGSTIRTPHSAKKRRGAAAIESTMEELSRLALHATTNIQHKDQLSLFVPAQFIAHLAVLVHAMEPSVLGQVQQAHLTSR
jgi:hypothetical protein